MMIRKSMISVAAAAAIVTGFTGCSSDTNNTSTSTSAVVNPNEQAKYTAPIQGLVIDDRGQFVEGATVTIGAQSTTTDSAGQYSFEAVDISAYILNEIGNDDQESGPDNNDEFLLVSIQPPAGSDMNNVVVGVTPEMVHVADANDGGDDVVVTHVVANSQSFTINSQVDTAMLTHKAANVEFFVGMRSNGTPVPEGTKVIAVYKDIDRDESTGINNNFANYITGVNSVFAYTDANGMVRFNNLLTSSEYQILVEGYNKNKIDDRTDHDPDYDSNVQDGNFNTPTYQGYAASSYVANIGNLMVTPITNGDEIAPRVATVEAQFGMYGEIERDLNLIMQYPYSDRRLMLQSSVTNTITINFTEAMMADNIADNVKVVSGNDFLAISSVDLTGNQLTVTLVNDLTDGQEFDILVFRDSNLADLAGNELAFIGASATDEGDNTELIALDTCIEGCQSAELEYLSCTVGSRAIQFSLMAYKELRLDAEGASGIVQMELDTHVLRADADASDLSDLENYSNAFNNVGDDGATVYQLNNVSGSDWTDNKLEDLAAALGYDIDVEHDTARVRFTANDSTIYTISVPVTAGCTTTNANVVVSAGSCNGTVTNGTNNTFIVNGFTPGEEVELLINGVNHADQVVITPQNDLCMDGTPAVHTLYDNVAPTTVLQNSYIGGEVVDGAAQIVPFGEGGELTNIYAVDAGMGLPALYVTPGLLDNLDAAGNNILGANNFVTGDESLLQELYIHNYADNNYSNPVEGLNQNVYDATDWEVFKDNMERDIGVAFTEDVVVPAGVGSFSGASVSGYTASNNVRVDDAGNGVYRDLVAFNTSNVMTLANVESDAIMSFDGIEDLAGNAAGAGHANVKILDGMPPFVTRAVFDGENVVITFNEAINLGALSDESSMDWPTVRLPDASKRAVYDPLTSPATWTLDGTGTVLTIEASAFTNGGLTAADFSINHNYDESGLYGIAAGNYKHAVLRTTFVEDLNGNSWNTWATRDRDRPLDAGEEDYSNAAYEDLEIPQFAMISNIGDFDVEVDNAGFVENDTNATQTIVWDFNQAVRTDATPDDFFYNGLTVVTAASPDAVRMNNFFAYRNSGGDQPLATFAPNAVFTLDATAKTVTLTFNSNVVIGDQIIMVGGTFFTSNIDPDQTESLSASANGAPVAP